MPFKLNQQKNFQRQLPHRKTQNKHDETKPVSTKQQQGDENK